MHLITKPAPTGKFLASLQVNDVMKLILEYNFKQFFNSILIINKDKD